jgi:hypothetical protein
MNIKETLLSVNPKIETFIKNGKQAIKSEYQNKLSASNSKIFKFSIDLEDFYKSLKEKGNYWDYLIVILQTNEIEKAIYIEFHPAENNKNIKEIIAKLKWLEIKANELELKKYSQKRFWIASGKVTIPANTKERKQLALLGISKVHERITNIDKMP